MRPGSICWNKTLSLAKTNNMTCNILPECFILILNMLIFVQNAPLTSSFCCRLFNSEYVQCLVLPMHEFELWTSGMGSDHSANWVTTAAHATICLTSNQHQAIIIRSLFYMTLSSLCCNSQFIIQVFTPEGLRENSTNFELNFWNRW